MRIVLFTKTNKETVSEVIAYLKEKTNELKVFSGDRNDKFPVEIKEIEGSDLIISYLSPWVISGDVLAIPKYLSINFHPGSPSYPGIGCFNFALYNQEKNYGVTAHYMLPKVDTGDIIGVRCFPIDEEETVYSLSQKSYRNMLILFKEIMDNFFHTKEFSKTNIKWGRKPYTRDELERLCELSIDMPKEEVLKRIKALDYPGMPGAYMNIHGKYFVYANKR